MSKQGLTSIGIFLLVFGFLSLKVKQKLYLGEACKFNPFRYEFFSFFSAILCDRGYTRTVLHELGQSKSMER